MGTDKWLRAAVFVAGVIFLVSFLWNGFHNRPAHDDFEFLTKVKELGIVGSAGFYYDHWNTRWSAILLANVFYEVYLSAQTFLPFHLLTLIVWATSVLLLVRNVTRRCGSEVNRTQLILITICVMMGTFFATFSIADSFYWINTSAMYLWNLIACTIFAASYTGTVSRTFKYIIAAVTGSYIGGSGETFVVVLSVYLMTILIINIFIKTLEQPSLLLAFLGFLVAGFIISYLGQGHVVRSGFLPDTDIMFKLWVLVKSMVKFFMIKLPPKIIPLVLFSLPWYYTGHKFRKHGILISDRISTDKMIIASVAIVCSTALLTFIPLAWLMSEMGPERSWNHLSWILYLNFSIILFFLGNRNTMTFIQSIPFQRLSGILLLLYVIACSLPAIRSASLYAEAWDRRMEMLRADVNVSTPGTILVKRELPEPKWLHTAEISSDPAHFTNQHLKAYLGSKKEILLKAPAKED